MAWDAAIAEAYASAPVRNTILHTLEFRHPSFIDADGNVTPVRIVRDNGELIDDTVEPEIYGHYLTLEGDAPVNPGASVLFQGCQFDFDFPAQQQSSLPDLNIAIDNISRIVSQYLENAVKTRDVVGLTYREFIITDTSEPKFILGHLTCNRAKTTLTGLTGVASFKDLINKTFPGYNYRRNEFRGLRSS
jgi:hypothetical protein